MTRTALVLGGGGITGIAWEWGILAGLAERGVDLRAADLVVGTSAGSVVGAQMAAGLDPEERYAVQLVPPDGEVAAAMSRGTLLRNGLAMIGSRNPQQVRARIGRLALRTRTVPEQERLDVIASRLPVREWPDRALLVTAVDAETGEFRPSTARPASRWCTRSLRAARCPGSGHRSPSTGGATSTAACGRSRTPTSRPATSGSSCWPRSLAASAC
jgi:predicted acylesterase/phospholipase RssA